MNYLYGHQLNSKVGEILEDLLVSTCFGSTSIYNMGHIRDVLEYLFYSMVMNDLLPLKLKNINNKMNMEGYSRLLSDLDVYCNGIHYKAIVPIINKVMANNIHHLLRLGNSGSHAANNYNSKDLNEYLNEVGTNNLINSCALQLCDIILWYEQTIKDTQKQIERRGKVLQWWSEN